MYKDNPQTVYRIELKKKILRTSLREFLDKGVKAVKMDNIANMLGISKRTLYEIYSNKEELLLECVRMHEEEHTLHMASYGADANHSVIDILIEFYKLQIDNLSGVSPCFFVELHKYKHVMDYLEDMHAKRERSTAEFFARGVKEGYFRSDVDFPIVTMIGGEFMEIVMRNEMYKIYDLKRILHNFIFVFIRGLCTAEGIKKLDEFFNMGEP